MAYVLAFRPRLLYFLVYKTADPNFFKMGKKIKSENRLFYIYFIPDRSEKGANEKKKTNLRPKKLADRPKMAAFFSIALSIIRVTGKLNSVYNNRKRHYDTEHGLHSAIFSDKFVIF